MKISDFFRKADIFLFVFLIGLGAAGVALVYAEDAQAGTVSILVDGELYRSCPLGADETVEVTTGYGSNTVVIENGEVYVTDSDCPGHDCERFGRISAVRQMIMCVPHHLCVVIDGESELDAVVY